VLYFRSGKGCLEGCFDDDQNRIQFWKQSFLEFTIAAFLTVAGHGSYFGFSDMEDPDDEYELGSWADSSWSYFPQYDSIQTGPPLGDAVLTNNNRRFTREFEKMTVMADCDKGEHLLVSKSAGPTSSPVCNESPFRFKIIKDDGRKMFRDCTWVSQNSSNHCNFEGVSSMCPSTCNACSTCIDSTSRFKFVKNGKMISRSCEWTATKNSVGRCQIEGMSDTCRDTCGSY